eukprot:3892403-Prorocentrum_lima.AAC.1
MVRKFVRPVHILSGGSERSTTRRRQGVGLAGPSWLQLSASWWRDPRRSWKRRQREVGLELRELGPVAPHAPI